MATEEEEKKRWLLFECDSSETSGRAGPGQEYLVTMVT